eukprot:scaffold241956_cov29-Tisochrysis_lutea.AAC.2
MLETVLALWILGRRYGRTFLALSLGAVTLFVAWSVFVVQVSARHTEPRWPKAPQPGSNFPAYPHPRSVALFNALLCNEAVRVNTNEEYEVRRWGCACACTASTEGLLHAPTRQASCVTSQYPNRPIGAAIRPALGRSRISCHRRRRYHLVAQRRTGLCSARPKLWPPNLPCPEGVASAPTRQSSIGDA